MPYQYAISVKTDKIDPKWNGYRGEKYISQYRLLPKELVDGHEERFKRFVTVTGHPLTCWFRIYDFNVDLTRIIKASQAPAVNDFYNTPLAVGDFVTTKHRKMDELQCGKIIGFVKQGKARIMPVGNYEQDTGILKFPAEMVKLPASELLGDDPEDEWVLAPEEMGMLID